MLLQEAPEKIMTRKSTFHECSRDGNASAPSAGTTLLVPLLKTTVPARSSLCIEEWMRIGTGGLNVPINASPALFRISDNELSPSIPMGALVLVDTNDRIPVNYGLHLVKFDGRLALRRIIVCSSGIAFRDTAPKNRHVFVPSENIERHISGRALCMDCCISDF